MRTVFFGSAPFATPVFARLAESAHALALVVTGPERPAGRGRAPAPSALAEAAERKGIRVARPADPHAAAFLAELDAAEADVFALASYGFLLRPELFERPAHGTLNVHASLLPRHRGASPIQRAILAGDERTGVSVQRIVKRLDAGDVLVRRELAIPPRATAGELLESLAELGGLALVEALDLLETGRARFEPQDESQATYAPKLTKHDGLVDWSRPAAELARHVRAMTPWPGARTSDPRGRALSLLEVEEAAGPAGPAPPGSVLESGARLVVATGAGALAILRLQPAGKRPLGAAEYLRGARLAAGERLGS